MLAKIVDYGKFQRYSNDRTREAIHILAKLGAGAKPALPILLKKLQEDEANPHWYETRTNYTGADSNIFAYTIAQIGEEALPELLKVYETDKDAKLRRAAVMSIGYMGLIAKSSLPKLEAEKKHIDELEEKSKDDEWLELALKKAITRISDPNAVPVEKMFRE